ncbi:MAG TPA: hypothetical protein VFJ47_11335 [Terriglobales bacterium]|nr:hypothetical protein [Terriglobales bacterium]
MTPRQWDRETALVAALGAGISVISFLIYFRHGAVLLYGDAVAHINIARRVFDSRTPGLLQLGTVWLPLPHLLMIPFLISNWTWRTGLGGSIPSMAAYVAGAVGIFRLVRTALSFPSEPDTTARFSAWVAAAVYAANPNLIYLQSTAMTEPVYLAFLIWAVVFLVEFAQRRSKAWDDVRSSAGGSLAKCGVCLAGAAMTRYDGWFVVPVFAAAVLLVTFRARGTADLNTSVWKFILLAAIVPVFWLAYNGVIYRNPLEFANGPYSAQAIERRSATPAFPPRPGFHNVRMAGVYFFKSAQLNMGEGKWQKIWVVILLAGSVAVVVLAPRLMPFLLLWLPLPFYMLSIAYGGVPLFIPVWWPFSYYNVRYGLQMLPAFAVFLAVMTYVMVGMARNTTVRVGLGFAALCLVAGSYAGIWREQPICFREAWVNSRSRMALENELAKQLELLPSNSSLLMYLGDHVGALQHAGIPLRRVIQEGNHRTWKRPADPRGLWEQALADPARYADYAVAIAGDPVWEAVQKQQLQSIVHVHATGQPEATIYRTRALPEQTQGLKPD